MLRPHGLALVATLGLLPTTALAQATAPLEAAQAALETGRFAEAARLAARAGAAGGAARVASVALRARALAAQGKVDQALALLQPDRAAPDAEGRRVRIALGELLIRAGRRADAEPVLRSFADDYNNDVITSQDAEGLAMVARAMHLLRHPKDANEAFKQAVRADRARAETHLWWAELFADSFDPADAQAELAEVLKVAPQSADAKVALARLKMSDQFDFAGAERLVKEALSTNPRHVGAFAVRAGMALRDMDLAAARAAIAAGLAVDPAGLELLSLRAAERFLADDRAGFEAAKKAIFARNREYSTAYGIIGDYAEWEHRYDDVIAMMKEAVALDPKDGKAWAELGLWQTRAGREREGVASLEEWWKHDRFNQRAFNTLEHLYKDWIPGGYQSAIAGVFDVRYPKGERPVLERYVPRMLGEAWGQMKVHYMFAPEAPVHVEMYATREHFSVRTSGLPNIGIQGVCFGHTVAAMSPESEPFNWGNVIWHELGHVFAIQLSKNHVPRWFTEGLSEYETLIRRPEWKRELDPELYSALTKHKLPAAVDMNRAFTHAEGGLDVTVAYYAASQMIVYTAEKFGFGGITRALELWGEGKATADVIQKAFGVSAAEYDAGYRAWQEARLSRYRGQYMFDLEALPVEDAKVAAAAAPSSAAAHVALAYAQARARQLDEAGQEINEALRLAPADRDAHFLASKLAKDPAARELHLKALVAAGGDGYAVQRELAEVAAERKDHPALRAALEAAHRFDPSQVEGVRGLLELAREERRTTDEVVLLRELAALDQHDRKAYPALLAHLVERKLWDEARRVGEAALYVDLENAAVHADYARALSAKGEHETASFELESALLCEGKPKDKAVAHALLAAERKALGDAEGARLHRQKALELDPECAEAKGLKI